MADEVNYVQESDEYVNEIIAELPALQEINPKLAANIYKLIQDRKRLLLDANIDVLTGLSNRRSLERIRDYSGVLMIDIDKFKAINDNFGHDIGDMVIKGVGHLLRTKSRANDYVVRYGGDEFTIVFTKCNEETMVERAEELRETMKNTTFISGFPITLSIGVAQKIPGENLEQTIKRADNALYQSKNTGKDKVVVDNENNLTMKM